MSIPSGSKACAAVPGQAHWSDHMNAHHLRNSVSSSSLVDQQPARPVRSQDSWQSTTIEHEHTTVSEEIYEFRHYSFAPQHQSLELSSADVSFEFVMEDPRNPQCIRERRLRSRADIEKQKEGVRRLKESGGSCIWCYRSKKRCAPGNPCQPCSMTGRKCIRSAEQLWLLVPSTTSEGEMIMQPPSHDALDMLRDLAKKAFSKETVSVGIHLRPSGDDGLETWFADITEADLDLSKSTQDAVAQLLDKSIAYTHCQQLRSLKESYGHHPIVHAALKMAFRFVAMSCLTKSRIHLPSAAADTGRFTFSLILVVGSRNLADMSEGFCAELYETLRRKDLHDTYSTGNNRPRGDEPLNPIWAATALYYRLVCGLLDLERSSPITKIFGSLETHLVAVRMNLWSILKSISIDNRPKSKRKPRNTLNEQIPVLSFSRHFDVAFWLGTIHSCNEFAPSGVLQRQSDPFAARGCGMEAFLQGEVLHPNNLPRASQPVRRNPGLTPSSQQGSVSDRTLQSETSTELATETSLDSKGKYEVLDLFQPTAWDMMGSIDSIDSGVDDCE